MGFWRTLGKIGSIAAPIVAAPFTGGASLALIGAGAGAANAALSGAGLKGTLLGAGLGGATAGIGSGAGTGVKTVAGTGGVKSALSTIGKSAIKNPDVLASLGNVAAGAVKGKQDQRITEGNQALNYAQLAEQAARDKYSADLAGSNAQFGAGMQGAQFQRDGQDRERKSALLQQYLNNVKDVSITGMNPSIAARTPTISGGLRPSVLTNNREALMAQLGQPQTQAPTYSGPSPYMSPTLPKVPTASPFEKALDWGALGTSFLGALGKTTPQGQAPTQATAVPSMPWTLPDEQDPFGNLASGAGDFFNPNRLQARF